MNQIGTAIGNNASQIRGEGAGKQSNKLNLGHTTTVVPTGPAPAPTPVAPTQQAVTQDTIIEKKVYVDVDSVEEKNIIAEAFAKMALLIMENKRLRSKLASRQNQLRQL